MAGRIGIIAGGDDLPLRLAVTCRHAGRDVFVVMLEGHADPSAFPPDIPAAAFRLGAAGAILDRLKAEGVAEVVLAGRVRRPSVAELRPDWKAAQLLARIGSQALGDDGLLRAVAQVLEEEGFRVVGAHELAGDLLTPPGVLSRMAPDAVALIDIDRGVEAARQLGHLDIGQAVVVQQGLILGVEAIEGTDALIARCAALKREGPGPVLVKARKPQQDHRLDLPAIGPDTVVACAAGGFSGIAVEAGGTLLLNRTRAVAEADRAGVFIIGIQPNGDA